MFEHYYSFFYYCLLSYRYAMFQKRISCKPKWGAYAVVRGGTAPPGHQLRQHWPAYRISVSTKLRIRSYSHDVTHGEDRTELELIHLHFYINKSTSSDDSLSIFDNNLRIQINKKLEIRNRCK